MVHIVHAVVRDAHGGPLPELPTSAPVKRNATGAVRFAPSGAAAPTRPAQLQKLAAAAQPPTCRAAESPSAIKAEVQSVAASGGGSGVAASQAWAAASDRESREKL